MTNLHRRPTGQRPWDQRTGTHTRPRAWGAGWALLILLTLLPAPWVSAHAIHTSIAEVDYNRTTRKLEVALRVFVDDFEEALGGYAKKKVSLARMPREEFDALARAYFAEKFTVRTAEGAPAQLEWVGREVKEADNELWFYFEVSLPGGIEGARLRHGVLGEQFSSQINSVRVRDGPRRVTLVFLPSQTEKTVRFRPQ